MAGAVAGIVACITFAVWWIKPVGPYEAIHRRMCSVMLGLPACFYVAFCIARLCGAKL